jgi:hypothetical protein
MTDAPNSTDRAWLLAAGIGGQLTSWAGVLSAIVANDAGAGFAWSILGLGACLPLWLVWRRKHV